MEIATVAHYVSSEEKQTGYVVRPYCASWFLIDVMTPSVGLVQTNNVL